MPPENDINSSTDENSPRTTTTSRTKMTRAEQQRLLRSDVVDLDSSFPTAPPADDTRSASSRSPSSPSCQKQQQHQRPNNNTRYCAIGGELDAAEVLRASLEFEQTQTPPPASSLLERAASSSTLSLYPSLEFVKDVELENSWRDGVADSSVASAPFASPSSSNNGLESTKNFSSRINMDDSAESSSESKRAARTSRTLHRKNQSPQQNTKSLGDAPSSKSYSSSGVPCQNGEGSFAPAAVATATATSVSNIPYYSSAAAAAETSTSARASIPRRINNDDEELIAMKRAAYGGEYIPYPTQTQSTCHHAYGVGTPLPATIEQQADAIVIEENVHPSDIETDAVQAEFVSTSDTTRIFQCDNNNQQQQYGPSTTSINGVHNVTAVGDPMPIAAQDAWTNASHDAEATVLHEEDILGGENDRKPPAISQNAEAVAFNNTTHACHFASSGIQHASASAGQEAEATVLDCDFHHHPSTYCEVHYGSAQVQVGIDQQDYLAAEIAPSNNHDIQPSVVPGGLQGSHDLNTLGTSHRPEAAEATVVDYDVHPSEMSLDAVHAELRVDASPAAVAPQDGADATIVDYNTEHPSSSESPRPESLHHPMEQQDDPNPSAHQQFNSTSDLNQQEAEATIVGCDMHPSELSFNAVQAEFVGQDFSSQIHNETSIEQPSVLSAGVSHVSDVAAQSAVEVGATNIGEATEATVIASGPMHKATREAWSAEPASEAQVIVDNAGPPQPGFDDGKPPIIANDVVQDRATNLAMADSEAEVVDVAEDAHPSEFPEDAAQAELIGSDYGCAIAVPSNGHDGIVSEGRQEIVEEATFVVEGPSSPIIAQPGSQQAQNVTSYSGTHEAHATLINDNRLGTLNDSNTAHQSHAVTAVLEESYATRDSSGQPATPVTVMESTFETEPTEATVATPKADPLADRSTSAPIISETENLNSETRPETRSYSSGATPTSSSRVHDTTIHEDASSIPPIPPPVPPPPGPSTAVNSTASRTSRGSNRSESSNGLQSLSSSFCRGTMEMLFGNNKSPGGRQFPVGFDSESMAGSILPRSLLPSSVIFSEATNSWVATVNTNQKALESNNVEESSKALRAFSVPTKKQAMALARAWAPPRMLPFESNQRCFICENQFAVFRRPSHCRNCGVVICGACIVQWPSKMLPATYNSKKESVVKICKGCDWLSSAFRLALLHGEHDKAVALHSTGNINLTTPFANVKGELFYPVHCAVLGGNLGLLKWLVDEHCCPLRSIRISHGKEKDSHGSYTPILTSKGRSLLGIALKNRNVAIVRYLVAEKRMLLSAEKGLSIDTLVQNLDLVLRVLPEEVLGEQGFYEASSKLDTKDDSIPSQSQSINTSGAADDIENTTGITDGVSDHEYADIDAGRRDVEGDVSSSEECIICFNNPIDCVATPCGHQICCLECGQHISRCPVCAVECSFMRVFKP